MRMTTGGIHYLSFEAKLDIVWRNQPIKKQLQRRSDTVIIWIWTKRKCFLRPKVSMMMVMMMMQIPGHCY